MVGTLSVFFFNECVRRPGYNFYIYVTLNGGTSHSKYFRDKHVDEHVGCFPLCQTDRSKTGGNTRAGKWIESNCYVLC